LRLPHTLVAVMVLGALAAPAVSQGQGPVEDSVTGSGTAGPYSFVFDAHSGPSGAHPTGTAGFSLTEVPSVFARGPVSCLAVQGDHAVIGIANDPGSVGQGALIEVFGSNTVAFSIASAPPTDCSTGVGNDPVAVTSGAIAITDARALPMAKAQCKNRGWQTYGAFKNQGECVSFVATGGKSPPGAGSNP
jgi:hypothetical protein